MKAILDSINQLITWIKPPQLYHWKTTVFIGLFLWVIALKNQGSNFHKPLILVSVIFFILTIELLLNSRNIEVLATQRTAQIAAAKRKVNFAKFSLIPWLAGAIACGFLWLNFEQNPIFWIIWPLVSMVLFFLRNAWLANLPIPPAPPNKPPAPSQAQVEQTSDKLTFVINLTPPPKNLPPPIIRPGLILDNKPLTAIIILAHILASCWIAVYFLTEYWLDKNPKVAVNFSKKLKDLPNWVKPPIVPKKKPVVSQKNPKNINIDKSINLKILKFMESYMRDEISQRSPKELQKWLTDISLGKINLSPIIRHELIKEGYLMSGWDLDVLVSKNQSAYQIELVTTWYGSPSPPQGYYFRKTCDLSSADDPCMLECDPEINTNFRGTINN